MIVVGLGNSLLSDDGVGLQVAARLRPTLPAQSGVTVIELAAGGLRLMEALVGHQRAIIVDAMVSGTRPPGSVALLTLESPEGTRNLFCAHDGDLATALAFGRDLGLKLPDQIEIIGIEAQEVEIFSETLTDRVAAAVPVALSLLRERLDLQ